MPTSFLPFTAQELYGYCPESKNCPRSEKFVQKYYFFQKCLVAFPSEANWAWGLLHEKVLNYKSNYFSVSLQLQGTVFTGHQKQCCLCSSTTVFLGNRGFWFIFNPDLIPLLYMANIGIIESKMGGKSCHSIIIFFPLSSNDQVNLAHLTVFLWLSSILDLISQKTELEAKLTW